jgi:hypothetical protein
MKFNLFLFACILLAINSVAQNVGVGTATPAERLDVNGNINVTGTIKANGTDGQPNQVLMKNTAGNFVWGDLCSYKDVAMFYSSVPVSWTVPAGVTKILVEAWGGGGGGSAFSGGGGAAYTAASFTVAPGDVISMIIGEAGTAGSHTTNGGSGGQTSVNVGPYSISAGGGWGAPANITMSPVMGGAGNASNTFLNYITMRGGSGKPGLNTFTTHGANTYEIISGGDGGSAANTEQTGGMGSYRMILTGGLTTTMRYRSAEGGKAPGGGGGSGYSLVSNTSSFGGSAGGYGMVIIHY